MSLYRLGVEGVEGREGVAAAAAAAVEVAAVVEAAGEAAAEATRTATIEAGADAAAGETAGEAARTATTTAAARTTAAATTTTAAGTGTAGTPAAPAGPGEVINAALSTLTLWIPGEALAVWMLVVGITEPRLIHLAIVVLLSMCIPPLSGMAKNRTVAKEKRRQLWSRGVLGGFAFVVWSFLVPGGPWGEVSWVASDPELITILAFVLAIAFPMAAEAIVIRLNPAQPAPAPAPAGG